MNISNHSDGQIDDQREIWEREYRNKGKIWRYTPCEDTSDDGTGIFIDLGSGDGKNLRRISQSKNLRIGIDFSMQSLLLSKKDPALEGVCFVCADVRHLPFKSNTINNADAHHLLGHVIASDRILVVNEIERILIPGGRLFLTVFGKNDFRSQKGREIEPGTFIKGDGIITHFFKMEELITLHPYLYNISVNQSAWTMKIRGVLHQRVLFVAAYKKI